MSAESTRRILNDVAPTEEQWEETLRSYRDAGWEGEDPGDWERMFWEAGFKQGARRGLEVAVSAFDNPAVRVDCAHARDLLRRQSAPAVPTDEREALARVILGVGADFTLDPEFPRQREALREADHLIEHGVGFRRQGPITDAQLRDASNAVGRHVPIEARTQYGIDPYKLGRAVLEAARDAS